MEDDSARLPEEMNITRPLFEDAMVGNVGPAKPSASDVEGGDADLFLEDPIIRHRAPVRPRRCTCLDRKARAAPETCCPVGRQLMVNAVSPDLENPALSGRVTRSQARAAQDAIDRVPRRPTCPTTSSLHP
jgi:hypothetical protein